MQGVALLIGMGMLYISGGYFIGTLIYYIAFAEGSRSKRFNGLAINLLIYFAIAISLFLYGSSNPPATLG